MTDSASETLLDLHTHASSYRESMLEHLFVGAIMRELWLTSRERIEVLKPQVDASGYDLVLAARRQIRYVQLKASRSDARTPRVPIHLELASRPSGCIVWIKFDPESLEFGPFLWFGGEPGEPLPDLSSFTVGTHTRHNATGVRPKRSMIRMVPRGAFTPLATLPELIARLFGSPPNLQLAKDADGH